MGEVSAAEMEAFFVYEQLWHEAVYQDFMRWEDNANTETMRCPAGHEMFACRRYLDREKRHLKKFEYHCDECAMGGAWHVRYDPKVQNRKLRG